VQEGGMTMAEPTSDKHYEEKFEFELWKLIKKYAEEKDISYHVAMLAVLRKFEKKIRYRDTEFENMQIAKRRKELLEVSEYERRLKKIHEGD
jgi:hypothetical protein